MDRETQILRIHVRADDAINRINDLMDRGVLARRNGENAIELIERQRTVQLTKLVEDTLEEAEQLDLLGDNIGEDRSRDNWPSEDLMKHLIEIDWDGKYRDF